MTNRTTEEIARGLTEAQRRAVLTDDRGFHPNHFGKWSSLTQPTADRLFAMGLIQSPKCLAWPTDLGLAVRSHLESHKP